MILNFLLELFGCPITITISILMIYIYMIVISKEVKAESIAISSITYLDKSEYWRGITAIFTHYDIMHLAGNIYSSLLISFLEYVYGNIGILKLITIIAIFAPFIDSLIRKIFDINRKMYCVGFSYIIFGLLPVIYKHIDQCKIFGFAFPCILVPFIEMIISQIVSTNSSFVGHLSGIIVGFALYFDFFFWYTDNMFCITFPLIVFFYFNSYIKYKKKNTPNWKRGKGRYIGC